MITGILEKTPYLQGLENLFFKYGIREVYSFNAFDGTKSEGISFIAVTDRTDFSELDKYVDPVDYDKPYCTEQISGFVADKPWDIHYGDLVYKDGVFFKTNGNTATQNYYREVYKNADKG